MATKKEMKADEDIVEAAIKLLKDYQDRESENIKRAEEAIRFRALEQWPTKIKQDRENEHQDGGQRPCPVLDKTNQYVRQIINEERQNRAAIKVRPVDSGADTKVAEIFTGIIRHIEDQSEAIEAYTTGGEHAIDGGFGYFRVMADYCDDMSFDQDILIKRVPNRFSVALGPHAEPDGADAKEGLIWEDMRLEDFKREFPDAKEVSFDDATGWAEEDTVRVAEYMCIKSEPMKIHLMDDGSVFDDEKLEQSKNPEVIAAAMEQGVSVPQVVDTRDSFKKTVKWYKVTKEEVIDKRDLVGTYIPIIKVTGNELTMPDGKIRTSGAIESMMDPQRLHNYAHAGFVENVALAPRAPWVAGDEAVEGYESDYENANRLPIALLKYKQFDDNGNAIAPPQRTPPPGISSGWQQMLQNTEHGIESAIGMYGPSVGAQSQEKSGIALQEQKNQGMVGNYHFPDNLSRSIQHCGRILLQWIPKYYDTERTARILGENGDAEMIKLNPNQEQAVMPEQGAMGEEIGSIYNLNVGKYDVTASTGPSYTAKRQEAADTQLQVLNARPEMLEIIGDIVFENMDSPGSDTIAKRLKTMLPPQIQELEASEGDGPVDPKMQMMQQQIQMQQKEIEEGAQMLEQRAQELQQVEMEIKSKAMEIGSDQKELQSQLKEIDSRRKLLVAEAKIQQADLESQARELIEQIENGEKPDIDLLKLQQDAAEHDREMDLKEYEASVRRTERGELVTPADEAVLSEVGGTLEVIAEQIHEKIEGIREKMDEPKPLSIQRDGNREIIAVNGRPIVRDNDGNMAGIE